MEDLFGHYITELVTDQSNALSVKIFRIWSAGCADGTETFNLKSWLKKLAERHKNTLQQNRRRILFSIYGTDIREDKLEFATAHESEKYWDSDGGSIIQLHFRRQDLLEDEPLSHVDLIFCRNVLMFFQAAYQEIIFKKLFHSLKKNGYLVLGRGEYLKPEAENLFQPINKRFRIYQKV